MILSTYNYRRAEYVRLTSPSLLPIDECEEWIWDILDSNKDSGFEYIADGDKEFLIFNTNDFHADTRALYKIRKDYRYEISTDKYSKMLYSPLVLSIKISLE